jgi:UPF0755 protein
MTRSRTKKILIYIVLVATIGMVGGGVLAYRMYGRLLVSNVKTGDKESVYINIPTGSTYADVIDIVNKKDIVIDTESFKWACSRMGYPHSVKAGRYKFKAGMTNREMVNILRAGLQTPVRVTFTGFRKPQQLAQKISKQIEADSAEIVEAFLSEELVREYGFTPETFIAMFVPNTYEFFWNTSTKGFFDRMKREYEAFWTTERDRKAEETGLGRIGVVSIASIVEEETIRVDERPKIAGVFINRLNRGTPLQACPTVKYALDDFTIKRVLTHHLTVDSPYNTYKHRGLPPGPINAPSISSIDAVLNYEKHSYYYFSANPDFSGYHVFAKTLAEHNRNARIYQRELNKQRIYR